MKVLVTGVAGFIGANLVMRLLKDESPISVLGVDSLNDYYDPRLKDYRLAEIEKIAAEHPESSWQFVKGNIADKPLVDKLFKEFNPEIVVNLAAQAGVRYSITNPDAYIESNLIGFYNILEACRHSYGDDKTGVQHLVYASSSSVYGSNKKVPYSTDDKVDNPVSLYAATKKSDELLAHAYSKLYNIPSTGLRFFTVYGPAGRPDMAYFGFTNKLLKGDTIEIFNFGNCKRDFTYVDDIVEGVIRVMKKAPEKQTGEDGLPIPPYKVYNIGNNHPENLLDFVQILQEELVAADVLPKDYDFRAHKRLVPMQLGDVPITYADTSALEADFGFKPSTTLREGLRKFAQWYRSFYMKPSTPSASKTVKQKFNELMSSIFKDNWVSVKVDDKTNNYIGAIAAATDFNDFKVHFNSLTNDLVEIYSKDAVALEKLVRTFRELAADNGTGAYSEICALHLLNLKGHSSITTDVTLDKSESFADELGHTSNTNMDGYIDEIDLYFDTKAFRDTITPILKNVEYLALKEIGQDPNIKFERQPAILLEFPHTDSEEKYKLHVRELVEEFVNDFLAQLSKYRNDYKKIKLIKSSVVPGLNYRFNWGGMASSESVYDPFERAENLVEPILVRYTDKFLKTRPFVLVLVNHPWQNSIDTDTFEFNAHLYRALSRRIFMQFRHDPRLMSDLNSKFKGTQTIDEVSKHISAILYIDVHSNKPSEFDLNDNMPYKWQLFINPRAVYKLTHSQLAYFKELSQYNGKCEVIEDFGHDNY